MIAAAAGALATATPAAAAAPANDARATAAPVGALPATVAGTLAGATREPGETHYGDGSVWYSFAPSADAAVAVETDFAPQRGHLARRLRPRTWRRPAAGRP